MTDDQPTPAMPPPPSGTPASNEGPAKPAENPIAMAGLMISLAGVVLSIVVIGGFVGFFGFILSSVGLRRSKVSGVGRGAALGGLALSLLSLLFSIGALAIIISTLSSGDEIVVDGVVTTSTNTEFPPQADIESVVCEESTAGGLPLAVVTIENNSPGPSLYAVTIEWESDGAENPSGTVRSEMLESGERQTMRLFDQSGLGAPDTCHATRIERSGLGFLPG